MDIAILIVAGLCGLAGAIWICVIAIQNGEIAWGILSLLCGIVAIIYAVQNFEQCKIPLALLAIGICGNIAAQLVT